MVIFAISFGSNFVTTSFPIPLLSLDGLFWLFEVKKAITDNELMMPITASFYDAELEQSVDAEAVEDEARQSVKAS